MKFTRFAPVVAGFGLMALANLAHAALITGLNSDFTINWFLAAGAADHDNDVNANPFDLSATADFKVTDFSHDAQAHTNSVTFDVTFTNTTVVPAGQKAGVTTFGFGIDRNLVGIAFDALDGNGFSGATKTKNGNFPGGFKDIDVCIFTSGCSGGAQPDAIAAGSSDTFRLILTFGDEYSSIILDPFPIKFQTLQNSYEFADCAEDCTPTKVPEPGTAWLLGAGLVGLGLLRRRHASKG